MKIKNGHPTENNLSKLLTGILLQIISLFIMLHYEYIFLQSAIYTFLLSLQVIVELRVVFLKIGEIDTLKEQYSADTFIQAKWREPALDGKTLEVSGKTIIYN